MILKTKVINIQKSPFPTHLTTFYNYLCSQGDLCISYLYGANNYYIMLWFCTSLPSSAFSDIMLVV